MSSPNQTIFALSSGQGRAGVAVIRISGPLAGKAIEAMAAPLPKPRVAALRRICRPGSKDALDYGLVLWFPAPRSETGENMAELQVHGGRAVIQGVLSALGAIEGCRMAEPGEFARRAFENGRLDLTGVEGLADLIDAETELQRRQALVQCEGALHAIYEGWRRRMVAAVALVEAAIDFSDEADVAADSLRKSRAEVEALHKAITAYLDDGHRGEILREGFKVVLAGPPNVGKSSLLNALARRDVAIVSDEPGTTRDVLEAKLDLAGVPIVLSDTAGIRDAKGKVEEEGIRRTMLRAREADHILWLVDASAPDDSPPPPELRARGERVLVVVNKTDLLDPRILLPLPEGSVSVSAKTGFGIDRLTKRLGEIAAARIGSLEQPALTHARHRQLLERCAAALSTFLRSPQEEVELRAEDLRRAAQALGRLVGAVDAEEVLGEIFARFCIGK